MYWRIVLNLGVCSKWESCKEWSIEDIQALAEQYNSIVGCEWQIEFSSWEGKENDTN